MKNFSKRAWTVWLLVPFLVSCGTYNKSMNGYYENLKAHNYVQAKRNLEKNKIIKKDRNKLLYNLELGKLYYLQNDFVNSNIYFNRADGMMETNGKSVTDIAVGNLLNPMQQAYRGEDFERFMVHYYKALNYSALGQMDDAVVEARRITLSENMQNDKFANKENRYSKDAFALNLQGMIYEMAGDINNAFIAYRNAADIYLKAGNDYYGVKMPLQLQKDLIRTADAMSFKGEGERYKKLFNTDFFETTNSTDGELVLFIEQGQAPVKEEKNFFITGGSNGLNSFNYIDGNGRNANFNFNANAYGIAENKLSSMRAFRLSLPTYKIQNVQQQPLIINNAGISYNVQLAQDFNNVAVNVLKERFVTEMANALARQIVKKLVEKGTQAAAEGLIKSSHKNVASDTTLAQKEKLRKDNVQKAEAVGEVAGFVINMINTATEKADTRNWQSLPAFVNYVRIPLHKGENIINITAINNPIIIKINSGKGLQMKSVVIN